MYRIRPEEMELNCGSRFMDSLGLGLVLGRIGKRRLQSLWRFVSSGVRKIKSFSLSQELNVGRIINDNEGQQK